MKYTDDAGDGDGDGVDGAPASLGVAIVLGFLFLCNFLGMPLLMTSLVSLQWCVLALLVLSFFLFVISNRHSVGEGIDV